MTSGARQRLFWTLIFFEVCVISITAITGLSMAVAHGGSIMMAMPLLMIAAAETLRIPLSGYATQLSWPKQFLAGVVLLAIAFYKSRRQSVPLNRGSAGFDGGAKVYRS